MHVILLGPQGAGKGTQAKMLSKAFALAHICTGDLFREHISKQTAFGKKAKQFIDAGKLVPDSLTITMIKERFAKPDCKKGFILDGFPRTLAQAEALDEVVDITHIIEIKIGDALAIKRLTSRRQCKVCGKIYGIDIPEKVKGKCDNDNSPLYQRDDDKEGAIKKRLHLYHEETEPLLEYYKPRNITFSVDGSLPVEKTFQALKKILEETSL
ncbi:adenylate kinase [Candidatus Woesearchaeota archaeon]|nr:adenylate kinase [Candidatus Woesearchaeota archaeon]